MSTDLSKRLPLTELQNTQEYQRLTPKQRLFVATYCEGGMVDGNYDPVAATQTAYACKTLEIARVMSYTLMANIRVIAVLNRHFNAEPIEEFLVQIDRAINNKHITLAQMQALKLKCDILGYANRLPGAPGKPRNVIPPDIAEASKQARKAKHKHPEKAPKSEPAPSYGQYF